MYKVIVVLCLLVAVVAGIPCSPSYVCHAEGIHSVLRYMEHIDNLAHFKTYIHSKAECSKMVHAFLQPKIIEAHTPLRLIAVFPA